MAGIKNIVDNEAVRVRMGLQDLEDINTAIDSGLTAAHVFFHGVLGTVFEEVTDKVDMFYLNDDLFPVLPNNQFRLRLKQAFLKAGSVSIKIAGTRKDVLGASAETLSTDDYYVDYEKGLVFIDAPEYLKKYVKVTYSAGFTSTNKAPDWLKEAVLAYMPSVLLFQNLDDPSSAVDSIAEIQGQAAGMVLPYKRETAFNLSPMY